MSAASVPRSSVATLRAWFEMAPDAMLAVDAAGRIVLANKLAERMFGYAAEGLHNLRLDALLPESSASAYASSPRHDPETPPMRATEIDDETSGRKRDGQPFPVEIGLNTVTTDAGVITIASLRDISATPRARRAAERAHYDTFVAQISRLLLESPDYQSAIQRIPERVATALEVPAVAILSSGEARDTFQIRTAIGLSTTTAEVVASIFGNGRFVHHAFEGDHRDPITSESRRGEVSTTIRAGLARTRYPHFALAPLFGRYEPLGILIALAPATETFGPGKVAFLQAVANLLTATVQRSHAEEQLAHAQRLDAVGQLTGGIAHDFNNLLTVVSGNLQLLEMEFPDRPQAREIINGALHATDRGAELTRKLLTFARRQSLLPQPVRPGPMLAELGKMLERTLGETIAIRTECSADTPAVYADPSELDTALVNLALNSRDAMPRGGRLTITARAAVVGRDDKERDVLPGHYVAFRVSDTGTGMTPDVRARVLEPFFTTKGNVKGSGLGLSMVYGFVRQSGGCVAVDSQLGYGTRVEFFLPVAADQRPVHSNFVNLASPKEGATVLVVEDEAEVRNVAAAFLRNMGYEVLTAAGALPALQMLAAQPRIDLLFSDVVLADSMTGVELAEEARRQRPELAVLLVSGYVGAASGPRGAETTADFPLLHKPYRREQLGETVRAVLGGR